MANGDDETRRGDEGEKIEQIHIHTNSSTVDFELHTYLISICLLLSLGDTAGILLVSKERPDAR